MTLSLHISGLSGAAQTGTFYRFLRSLFSVLVGGVFVLFVFVAPKGIEV